MKVTIYLEKYQEAVFENVVRINSRDIADGLQYVLRMPYGSVFIHEKDIVYFTVETN
jgi:hypothetical protein